MEKFFEKQLSTKEVYRGKIFTIKSDEVLLSNGATSVREVIMHSGGVVAVAEADDKILMVKQYRYCVSKPMLELPAGKLEVGEDPLEAIKRELVEETGYEAKTWNSLGYIYPSAGICDEKLYLFKADNLTFVGAKPDKNEIIEHFLCPVSEVLDMVKNGEINDAKTICALARAYSL